MSEMASLDDLKILVPESRELDLFARMLEDEGATALRCPRYKFSDLENGRKPSLESNRLLPEPSPTLSG